MLPPYSEDAPDHETLASTPGSLVLEFGSNTCGICEAATPLIAAAMANSPIPHIRVQDGKGRRLGRQLGIKLWPTLIFLRDGQEISRIVRPDVEQPLLAALGQLANAGNDLSGGRQHQ